MFSTKNSTRWKSINKIYFLSRFSATLRNFFSAVAKVQEISCKISAKFRFSGHSKICKFTNFFIFTTFVFLCLRCWHNCAKFFHQNAQSMERFYVLLLIIFPQKFFAFSGREISRNFSRFYKREFIFGVSFTKRRSLHLINFFRTICRFSFDLHFVSLGWLRFAAIEMPHSYNRTLITSLRDPREKIQKYFFLMSSDVVPSFTHLLHAELQH